MFPDNYLDYYSTPRLARGTNEMDPNAGKVEKYVPTFYFARRVNCVANDADYMPGNYTHYLKFLSGQGSKFPEAADYREHLANKPAQPKVYCFLHDEYIDYNLFYSNQLGVAGCIILYPVVLACIVLIIGTKTLNTGELLVSFVAAILLGVYLPLPFVPGIGAHVGDVERVRVHLKGRQVSYQCEAHGEFGTRTALSGDNTSPKVYVARETHASYANSGVHMTFWDVTGSGGGRWRPRGEEIQVCTHGDELGTLEKSVLGKLGREGCVGSRRSLFGARRASITGMYGKNKKPTETSANVPGQNGYSELRLAF